ncbi:hypothetical protein F4859DRAFT_519418 [Xylaria cf. heliscus]|nr:hypothetical protein F4859DRAFT_519418 [Xylaria cf. heliscus]
MTPLTPSVLDHGYYASRLQIATPVNGWGQLAYLPNELIYMVLERCSLATLLNIMLVNRGALEFVLRLPGFNRVLATLLVHINALKHLPTPARYRYTIRKLRSRTYLDLAALTRAYECHMCGSALLGMPIRPPFKTITVCLDCSHELHVAKNSRAVSLEADGSEDDSAK